MCKCLFLFIFISLFFSAALLALSVSLLPDLSPFAIVLVCLCNLSKRFGCKFQDGFRRHFVFFFFVFVFLIATIIVLNNCCCCRFCFAAVDKDGSVVEMVAKVSEQDRSVFLSPAFKVSWCHRCDFSNSISAIKNTCNSSPLCSPFSHLFLFIIIFFSIFLYFLFVYFSSQLSSNCYFMLLCFMLSLLFSLFLFCEIFVFAKSFP